jgi:hypothetical protein
VNKAPPVFSTNLYALAVVARLLLLYLQIERVSGPAPIGTQSKKFVITYSAVGPSDNDRSVLANCRDNADGAWHGIASSRTPEAKRMVKKAARARYGMDLRIMQAVCATDA